MGLVTVVDGYGTPPAICTVIDIILYARPNLHLGSNTPPLPCGVYNFLVSDDYPTPTSPDEALDAAYKAGRISCDFGSGQIFSHKGPGGATLQVPHPIKYSRASNGYYMFSFYFGKKNWTVLAHRAVWVGAHGIPEKDEKGKIKGFVTHQNGDKLDNRLANLVLVESKKEFYEHYSTRKNAKLSWPLVREIRFRYQGGGTTMEELAKDYEVSASTIKNIIRGRAWRNDPDDKAVVSSSEPDTDVSGALSDSGNAETAGTEQSAGQPGHVLHDTAPDAPVRPAKGFKSAGELVNLNDADDLRRGKFSVQRAVDDKLVEIENEEDRWRRNQVKFLAAGQKLTDNRELYEHVKAVYMQTFGSATKTARICKISTDTVRKYAAQDGWLRSLEPETDKLSSETGFRSKVAHQADVLWYRMLDLADSLIVEEKDRAELREKGLGSHFIEPLSNRSSTFKVVYEAWMRLMGLLEPELFRPDWAENNRTRTYHIDSGGIDGINRQLADLLAGVARGAAEGASAFAAKNEPGQLIEGVVLGETEGLAYGLPSAPTDSLPEAGD